MSFHMLHFLQLFFQPMKMDIFNFDLITFLRHLQWWNLSYCSLLARIESDIAANKFADFTTMLVYLWFLEPIWEKRKPM